MSKREFNLAAVFFLIAGVFFSFYGVLRYDSERIFRVEHSQSFRFLIIGLTSLMAATGIRMLTSRNKRKQGK